MNHNNLLNKKFIIGVAGIFIISSIIVTLSLVQDFYKTKVNDMHGYLIKETQKESYKIYANIFSPIEMMVKNYADSIILISPNNTKQLDKLAQLFFSQHSSIVGGGYWLEYFTIENKKYFGPYWYKEGNNFNLTWEYSNEKNDYTSYPWYVNDGRLTSKQIQWSDAYKDAVTGIFMTTATSPLLYPDTTESKISPRKMGVVTIDVGLKELTNHIQTASTSHNNHYDFSLLSNKGIYLAHKNPEMIGKKATKFLYNFIFTPNQANKTVENDSTIYASSPIGSTGLFMLCEGNLKEIVAPVIKSVIYTTAILFLLITIFIGLLFWLIQVLTTSINETEKYTIALEESLQELERAQKKMIETEKQAALSKLVAGVAHEINTPIGLTLTYITYIKDLHTKLMEDYQNGVFRKSDFENFSGKLTEALEGSEKNIERAAQLIQSFKRVSVDQTAEILRSFEICNYLEDAMLSLKPEYKATPHSVNLEYEQTIMVNSYPGAIMQIVTNLVMNSLIHAFNDQKAGNAVIKISQSEGQVHLDYRDDGVGMDEQGLKKIFDPFYTTNRHQGGTGLGSHIIYNLVTQTLQGSITCESTPQEGTAFHIKFPQNLIEQSTPEKQ